MTLLVPFDGSDLAEAALVRATEFGRLFEEDVVTVSIIPEGNTEYAREHGWIGPDEEFDMQSVVSKLRTQVTALAPGAEFRHTAVDRYAPSGSVSNRVRKMAREEGISMVFIGSENAGHFVTAVSSVGANVAADGAYDVVIVRRPSPATVGRHGEASKLDSTPPE